MVFSYIAADEHSPEAWQAFLDRMGASVGRPVVHRPFGSVKQQLQAIENGELHVTALNTGSVPRAVNECGFVPVSVKANNEGQWEITMKLIVPHDSTVQKIERPARQGHYIHEPQFVLGFQVRGGRPAERV